MADIAELQVAEECAPDRWMLHGAADRLESVGGNRFGEL